MYVNLGPILGSGSFHADFVVASAMFVVRRPIEADGQVNPLISFDFEGSMFHAD